MSKLRELWEWLTIEDAANQLSIDRDEKITESDILRAALEGHLTLSVYFADCVVARRGVIVPLKETNWILVPSPINVPGVVLLEDEDEDEDESNRSAPIAPWKLQMLWRETPNSKMLGLMPLMTSLVLDSNKDQYLNIEEDIFHIRDGSVWDLPLIGNERVDVKNAYQQKTHRPALASGGINGAFVRDEKYFYQLQECYEDDAHPADSRASAEWFRKLIRGGKKSREEFQKLILEYGDDRRVTLDETERYYPAEGLPEGHVLVVRSTALLEFEEKIRADNCPPEKQLDPRERATFERLIYVLANSKTTFSSNDVKALQHAAELQGISITGKGTIAKYLSAAFERGEAERKSKDE